jgi:hypothetical protein
MKMPLNGQYEPSAMSFARDQVDLSNPHVELQDGPVK